MRDDDYLRYYHLEHYLFTDVSRRFQRKHSLGAFDLFSIIVWKANRAKSVVARRLKAHKRESLEAAARRLTVGLWDAVDDQARLVYLRCEWGLGLPMASAILSVCWPERFTVYDYRVCAELGGFEKLGNVTDPTRLQDGYVAYCKAVRATSPQGLTLRECDRFLWGRSAFRQLKHDIEAGFPGKR
jgi:hypothetical protein